MKTYRMHTIIWTGLILIVAVGFAGCKAAPPKVGPPVTKVEPGPSPPVRVPEGIQFEFADKMKKVYFEFDKSRLLGQARSDLEQNAVWLRNHPDIKVLIEGHCDERGTVEYNLGLGERRAMSVRSYLISLGIDSGRLFTISYGEERPVALGHNEKAWAQNRRTEFKIAQ